MSKKRITIMVIAIFMAGLVLGGIVGSLAFPREVIREVVKEVPMGLPTLAEKIREGEIDVGEEYGTAPGRRYHKIHAEVVGLKCETCHLQQVSSWQEIFFTQDVSPQAPGPVDRRVCLGCHGPSGPARGVYPGSSP